MSANTKSCGGVESRHADEKPSQRACRPSGASQVQDKAGGGSRGPSPVAGVAPGPQDVALRLPANPFCEGSREFSKWEDLVALMTDGRLWGSDYPVLNEPRPMSFEDAAAYMRGRALPHDETDRVTRHFSRLLQGAPQ